ncbi:MULTISPECIES: TIGR02611 family protein [Streptomyces]|uniref:TIGR02611 family protein n=1 Tax=Streptomyces tsukubensis (strain DSM 42081 / NBRC 108919 / NRRL 18488 / 9993) TaxID=1114943 RepID=A0A7G3UKZ1_STRT9|nr:MULTISPECIES: TIGR02611 family protein [Streptomyces]AZK93200.1 TIGR02611 family protein [Streptomyces tsukubensis]MYS64230.1 TIGR02611 family protein [Streptomyces sp. SID5473]QKM70638.1 TIGR02611 family protein [Streptomyces tsukubensis NRRL18488]TAI41267.1 TIGR02611 family protein [Streptomyces tsukubensis]
MKTESERGEALVTQDSASVTGAAAAGAAGSGPGPGTDAAGADVVDAADAEKKSEQELGSKAPAFIKRSRALHLSWQVGVFLVGLAVVGAGVAMLVLPGPGWVVIFAGMAIWATEFVWAQLVLRWTKRKVSEAAQRALDPRVRRRNLIITTIGVVICTALAAVYLWKFGLAMPWKIDQQ